MHHTYARKIELLQRRNQTTMITAIAVLVASLMITAMLPTFLLRYYYDANQQLFSQPALLEYIPLASFVIGIGYFVISVIGNALRAQQIKRLSEEMEMMGDDCEDCHCGTDGHHHDHHSESHTMGSVDSLAEALVKESKSSKRVTKTAKKKAKK